MCGLIGYTGNRPANISALKLIGVIQADRGKDSIGIFYDNDVHKYARTTGAAYNDNLGNPETLFLKRYLPFLHKPATKHNSIIIHNRASTRGTVDVESAHPYHYEKDGVDYFFAHNGTLTNEFNLAKEYGLDYAKFKTDSHLLGYIIVHHGFDVLKKYEGAAAFLLVRSDRPTEIVMWKGASYQEEDYINEERPLYYYLTKDQIYIASTQGALCSAFDIGDDQIPAVKNNTLMFVNLDRKNRTIEEHIYDRSHHPKKAKTVYFQSYGKSYNTVPRTHSVVTYDRAKREDMPVTKANQLFFYNGKYYFNKQPYTTPKGGVMINNTGTVYSNVALLQKQSLPSIYKDPQFFYQGLPLKDAETWEMIKNAYPTKQMVKEHMHAIISEGHIHEGYTLFFFDTEGLFLWKDSKMLSVNTYRISNIPLSHYDYTLNLSANTYTAEKRHVPTGFKNVIDQETDEPWRLNFIVNTLINFNTDDEEKFERTLKSLVNYMNDVLTTSGEKQYVKEKIDEIYQSYYLCQYEHRWNVSCPTIELTLINLEKAIN